MNCVILRLFRLTKRTGPKAKIRGLVVVEPMKELLGRYPELASVEKELKEAAELLCSSVKAGGKVMTCGNGGSACDGEHVVGELMKEFRLKRPIPQEMRQKLLEVDQAPEDLIAGLQGAIPALSLNSQVALMTALCNDVDSSMMFAQQVYGYGKAGDVLIAFSTSGNSKNVLNAVRTARAMGVRTLAISGESGGKIGTLADVAVRLPAKETFRIQELTLPVYHELCIILEQELFGK